MNRRYQTPSEALLVLVRLRRGAGSDDSLPS